jgi:hypothetical protein
VLLDFPFFSFLRSGRRCIKKRSGRRFFVDLSQFAAAPAVFGPCSRFPWSLGPWPRQRFGLSRCSSFSVVGSCSRSWLVPAPTAFSRSEQSVSVKNAKGDRPPFCGASPAPFFRFNFCCRSRFIDSRSGFQHRVVFPS